MKALNIKFKGVKGGGGTSPLAPSAPEEEKDIEEISKWCDKLEAKLERFRHLRKKKK